MTAKDWFTLKEAAELTGVKFNTLKTKAARGQIPTETHHRGAKAVRVVSWQVIESLRNNSEQGTYSQLLQQYLDELVAGTIAAKPVSARHVENVEYNLGRYWQLLDEKPTVAGVSAEKFRHVMKAIGVDDAAKRDYYAVKNQIYKAITGFMRLLIRDGYKTKADLEAIKQLKPGKKYTSITKDYPDAATVLDAIRFNLNHRKGRQDFDVMLTNTLLHLYAYTGIRRMEAAALVLDDIGTIVIDINGQPVTLPALRLWGKGGKRRSVPIPKPLEEALTQWRTEWRPELPEENRLLLTQKSGKPLTANSINLRFSRLSKTFGHNLMPHGLRHACATILANEGMPVVLIQRMLGHSHIQITNTYLNPTEADLFKHFHGREGFTSKQKPADLNPIRPVESDRPVFTPMF